MSNQQVPEPPVVQAYKINLSKGDSLPCDADELAKVMEAIKTSSPCKIRSGIFNPSYYVSITEDQQRIAEVQRENYILLDNNRRNAQLGGTMEQYKQIKPLKDIFAGIDLKGNTKLGSGQKQLN